MTAEDFLALAQRLAAGSVEVESRSAVSRAYYAVFHAAVRLIEACGVTLPKSAAAHEKTIYCLRQSGSELLDSAGLNLSALRGHRNAADYHLADARFRDRAFVQRNLAIAEQSMRDIAAAHNEIGVVRERIREYARKTLGLTVSE